MEEKSVMEIIKWFIGLIKSMTMVSIGIFCVQLQDINTVKQQVNYQNQRKGGLTTEAVEAIDKYWATN
ncbi:hypothetical protein AAH990_15085, partial [Enterococcus lactis]